jgi:hypothetical protein
VRAAIDRSTIGICPSYPTTYPILKQIDRSWSTAASMMWLQIEINIFVALADIRTAPKTENYVDA